LEGPRIFVAFLKILAASLFMGVAAYAASGWLRESLPGGEWYMRATRVFSAIVLAMLVLVASAKLMRIAEFTAAVDRVLERFVRR
jgi:hypothetical protein